MKRKILLIILAGLVVFLFSPVFAQKNAPTRQSISKEISALEKDIANQEKLLGKIKGDKKVTQNELKLVRVKMESRRKLVESLNSQIRLIEQEIKAKNKNIAELNAELERLKKEYAGMVYLAYKNYKTNNALAFIFASRDFNDAGRRIDYMKRYNISREVAAASIDSVSRTIVSEVGEMEKQLAELTNTKSVRDKEFKSLRSDEDNYNKSIIKLVADEKKVSGQIKQKEKAKRAAQAKLQKLIAEETEREASKKRTTAEAKKIAELSDKFDQNKGRFPLPVRGGVIIDGYGTHHHPTQKGVMKNNLGIDIAAEKGAQVRSIFEGTIARVVHINGMLNCVMVQHGDYIAVYTNLETISVKPGDNVARNQGIGTIPATGDNNDYFVHFELWKGGKHTNPEPWFAK